MSRVADTMYDRGHYTPGPGDPEWRPGGWKMPHGSLPRFVPVDPRHVPSTVVALFPTSAHVGAFGGRRPRWTRIARTECSCGVGWGRTRTVTSDHADDVHVRGLHVTHTLTQRTVARQEAA